MEKDFFIYLTYKDKKKQKFKVNNPKDTLGVLMERVVASNIFDMPAKDAAGAPIAYYFGKTDENGKVILLNPKGNKHLYDYQIEPDTELLISLEAMAG